MFKPGDLCNRVMIQTATEQQTSNHGTPKLAWKDSSWIWCQVQPLSSSEQEKATGQVTSNLFRIKTSFLGGKWIDAKMRGLWMDAGDMILNFTGLKPNPSEDELVIECAGIL